MTTEAPLDVHPALLAQGVEVTVSRCASFVLAHAGEENLVRVTFFLRAPPSNEVWFFGGFERDAGRSARSSRGGHRHLFLQRVILTTTTDTYEYDLTPNGTTPEDGSVLLSTAAADAASEEERTAAFVLYLRVENPTRLRARPAAVRGLPLASYVTAEATRRFGIDASTFADRFGRPVICRCAPEVRPAIPPPCGRSGGSATRR